MVEKLVKDSEEKWIASKHMLERQKPLGHPSKDSLEQERKDPVEAKREAVQA